MTEAATKKTDIASQFNAMLNLNKPFDDSAMPPSAEELEEIKEVEPDEQEESSEETKPDEEKTSTEEGQEAGSEEPETSEGGSEQEEAIEEEEEAGEKTDEDGEDAAEDGEQSELAATKAKMLEMINSGEIELKVQQPAVPAPTPVQQEAAAAPTPVQSKIELSDEAFETMMRDKDAFCAALTNWQAATEQRMYTHVTNQVAGTLRSYREMNAFFTEKGNQHLLQVAPAVQRAAVQLMSTNDNLNIRQALTEAGKSLTETLQLHSIVETREDGSVKIKKNKKELPAKGKFAKGTGPRTSGGKRQPKAEVDSVTAQIQEMASVGSDNDIF